MTNNYRMRCPVDINALILTFFGGKRLYVTFGKGTSYKFFSFYPNTYFGKLYISVYKNAMSLHSELKYLEIYVKPINVTAIAECFFF